MENIRLLEGYKAKGIPLPTFDSIDIQFVTDTHDHALLMVATDSVTRAVSKAGKAKNAATSLTALEKAWSKVRHCKETAFNPQRFEGIEAEIQNQTKFYLNRVARTAPSIESTAHADPADISFACDKCGQQLIIGAAGVGLVVQCPTCKNDITVTT